MELDCIQDVLDIGLHHEGKIFVKCVFENFGLPCVSGLEVGCDQITLERTLGLPTGHHRIEDELGFFLNDREFHFSHSDKVTLSIAEVILIHGVKCGKTKLADNIDVDAINFELGEPDGAEATGTAGILVVGLSMPNLGENLADIFETLGRDDDVEVVEIIHNAIDKKAKGAGERVRYLEIVEGSCKLLQDRKTNFVVLVKDKSANVGTGQVVVDVHERVSFRSSRYVGGCGGKASFPSFVDPQIEEFEWQRAIQR